jgi:uncharacterized membrane protein YtjA (UPF0391 family)
MLEYAWIFLNILLMAGLIGQTFGHDGHVGWSDVQTTSQI